MHGHEIVPRCTGGYGITGREGGGGGGGGVKTMFTSGAGGGVPPKPQPCKITNLGF